MDNNFNLSDLALNAIDKLKGLTIEQLMTVGLGAYFIALYKVNESNNKAAQLADNRYHVSPDDVIDVAEVAD